jgi:hypothetical protein
VLSIGLDLGRADDAVSQAARLEGELSAWKLGEGEHDWLGVGLLGPADHLALPADSAAAVTLFDQFGLTFIRACQGCGALTSCHGTAADADGL